MDLNLFTVVGVGAWGRFKLPASHTLYSWFPSCYCWLPPLCAFSMANYCAMFPLSPTSCSFYSCLPHTSHPVSPRLPPPVPLHSTLRTYYSSTDRTCYMDRSLKQPLKCQAKKAGSPLQYHHYTTGSPGRKFELDSRASSSSAMKHPESQASKVLLLASENPLRICNKTLNTCSCPRMFL